MEVSAASTKDPRPQLTCETLATYYITKPGADAPNTDGAAVLYLTDVFGINLTENKLYARALATPRIHLNTRI